MTGNLLDVRADGEHQYKVEAGGGTYCVTVPPSLLERLALEPQDEPLLVRQALELMLARPGEKMPERFDLEQAAAGYPGLVDELRTTVGRN